MVRKLSILLLVGCIGASLPWAAPHKSTGKQELSNLPASGTLHCPDVNLPLAPLRPPHHTLDDYVGTVDTAGTTWCDIQHFATCGRMIGVDNSGRVSLVWMNCLVPDGLRCIYYNAWNPDAGDFVYDSVGISIDLPSMRSGYVSQVTSPEGFCFVAFHGIGLTGDNLHAFVACDYAPWSDAFTVIEVPPCYDGETDLPIGYPKISMDASGNLHLISTEIPLDPDPEAPLRIHYSRGVPEFDPGGFWLDIHWDSMSCGAFEMWDTVGVLSSDVACSRHSERCAIAWLHGMGDSPSSVSNDIYLRISEDGGLNWGEPFNVTLWTPWDPEHPCDTLRSWPDLTLLLDGSDNVHIAFTIIGLWAHQPGEPDSIDPTKSMIYHWSEETGFYSLVANGWYEAYEPGAWQRNVQRPSLASDPQTGYLYCSYMRYDTTTYSECGYPMADAVVTVSTTGGCSWAVGTNVTNTTPDVVPVPTGESMHERDITVAPLVTHGFLNMEYVLDKDAGSAAYGEGVETLNPVIYQRIPVDQIAIAPLLPEYPMHWDSTGYPDCEAGVAGRRHSPPSWFRLCQNYPNPFNPTTTLHFDLGQRANVTLKVYNILGQEVATLFSDAPLSAGTHMVEFDGSGHPSGIYIYQLETPEFSAARKMVLLK